MTDNARKRRFCHFNWIRHLPPRAPPSPLLFIAPLASLLRIGNKRRGRLRGGRWCAWCLGRAGSSSATARAGAASSSGAFLTSIILATAAAKTSIDPWRFLSSVRPKEMDCCSQRYAKSYFFFFKSVIDPCNLLDEMLMRTHQKNKFCLN